MIFGVPIFLAMLAFVSVVFVHELGHYLIGRWCGIGASTFSIGFGPKLFSYKDRHGTEWMFCLIPLGGYVKFITENRNSNLDTSYYDKVERGGQTFGQQDSFESASLVRRSMTVLAGPIANFLMAAIIFSFVAIINGKPSNEPVIGNVAKLPEETVTLMVGDRIISVEEQAIENFGQIYEIMAGLNSYSDIRLNILRGNKLLDVTVPHLFQPIVFYVEMFSPAMKAGIQVGDVFLNANNQLITSFDDLKNIINSSIGGAVKVKIWRNNSIFLTELIPEMRPTETLDGDIVEEMRIGVRGGALFSPQLERPGVIEALHMGFRMTGYVIKTSLVGLARMIDNTISPKHLSGPIGVAKALSHTASEGLIPFLSLLATISAGIGLINLFPIPILDGGYLMIFLYEGVFKKPPSDQIIKFLMAVGLAMLVALMVFASFNDIVR